MATPSFPMRKFEKGSFWNDWLFGFSPSSGENYTVKKQEIQNLIP
jgi:hypothetical protein